MFNIAPNHWYSKASTKAENLFMYLAAIFIFYSDHHGGSFNDAIAEAKYYLREFKKYTERSKFDVTSK